MDLMHINISYKIIKGGGQKILITPTCYFSVDGATHLEKFITNLQRERSEVAFHIFTYGKQRLALNLSERFTFTDEALEQMPWPTEINSKTTIFKSKLRFQIRHGDFRERISQV